MRSPRARPLAVVTFVVVVLALGRAPGAGAHAVLERTEPSGGQVLDSSPTRVVLHFDEQVEVSFGSIRLYDASGQRVDVGAPAHLRSDSHAVTVSVPHLDEGGYVVTWRVVSADSHPVHGAFTFRIGSAAGADTSSLGRRLLAADGGSTIVGAAYAAVRWLAYLSVTLVVGGMLLALFAWKDALADRRARSIVVGTVVAALAATVLGIGLQGVYAGGLGVHALSHSAVWRSVLHTRFGHVWAVRCGLLLLAAWLLVALRREDRHPVLTAAGATVALALAASFGLAGHPATGDDVALAVVADVLHVGAVSIWFGGLTVLAGAVLARRDGGDGTRAAVERFSTIALGCVVTIIVTGAFQTWRQVGSLDGLTKTTYGRLLLVKLGLFVALVAVASASRRWLRARGTRDESPRGLRRRVGGEAAFGVAILGVTALLVNAQPARSALALPYSAELPARHVLVDVVVDPAKAGPITVHLYTLTPEGAVKDVPQITATFELPEKQIGPIDVASTQAGQGHFLTTGFDLPVPGRWLLTVKVLLDELTQEQVTTTVVIR